MLRETAQRYPDRTAIVFKDRRLTFGEVDRESNRLAHALRARGVGEGDRLGLFLPNCPEYEIGFYAAAKLGAVASPLNPAYKAREVVYQANEAGVKVLLTRESLLPVLEEARPSLKTLRQVVVVAADHASPGRGSGGSLEGMSYASAVQGQPETAPDVDVRRSNGPGSNFGPKRGFCVDRCVPPD